MKLKSITANFLHNVINEKITIEFLFQYENFVLDKDTVIIVKAYNFVIICQYI